jgi:SnoaL-like domain
MEAVVRAAVSAIATRDWDRLKPFLHPYVRWTDPTGATMRGRTNVLGRLATARPSGPPARVELRDGQIYRWVEG